MGRPGPRDEPAPRAQQLVGQALRAQASGAATRPAGRPRRDLGIAWYLALALLVGALLGVGLALLSVLAPGVLPTIG
jgi:hypothetical protein